MSLLGAIGTAVRAGIETRAALDAWAETWATGAGPIAALRAFAAETEGTLDDAALGIMVEALAEGMVVAATVIDGAVWLLAHGEEIRSGAVRVADAAAALPGLVASGLDGVAGAAYWLAAQRETVRRWSAG